MSPFYPLVEFDARNNSMHIVSTDDIAYLASKKNFDPSSTKELKYIEKSKSKKSVCKCHHPHFIGGRCYYHTCRHTITNHLGFGKDCIVDEEIGGFEQQELRKQEAEEIAAQQDCVIESCYGKFDE